MLNEAKNQSQKAKLRAIEKRNKKERKKYHQQKPDKEERLRKKQEQKKYRKKEKIITTQQSIPYKRMLRDGVCQVTDYYFTKTIRFFDRNYELLAESDQTRIFELYRNLFNRFDASLTIQFSFYNREIDLANLEKEINIEDKEDGFNDIRNEYRLMLKKQLENSNNRIERMKYLTFGLVAEDIEIARTKLWVIEEDILKRFKTMGVKAYSLEGEERLELLYHLLNPKEKHPFHFSYEMFHETGMTTKDFIVPPSFDFSKRKQFEMSEVKGCVSFLRILASEFYDDILRQFLDVNNNLAITLHIQPISKTESLKIIKRRLSDLEKAKIEEQKNAVHKGYDMDILPPDLVGSIEDAKLLLENIELHNEKLFNLTFLVMNVGENDEQVDHAFLKLKGVAEQANCELCPLDYQQENGLVASLPLGINEIKIKRQMTSSSLAIFIPFAMQDLFQGGEALYYGINPVSNTLLMLDRKKLKTPNGLILGTPGSGKSFSAKREICNVFLVTNDDIIVCDPEAEYFPLVEALNGQVIKINAKSKNYINPMDVNLDIVYHPERYEGEDLEGIIADKSQFLLSFCEMILKRKNGGGLEGDEENAIDLCVKEIYRKYLYHEPKEENMPILEDLLNKLEEISIQFPAAKSIANSLSMYVNGTQCVFNHRTNVDMKNRVICFDIKELSDTFRKVGMLVIQNLVWTKVSTNRNRKKSTRYYVDEFHLLLRYPQTAVYSVEMWKRFRKWGGIPTGITQNINDLLVSRQAENIIGNSDFIYMLSQHEKDREILGKYLNISKEESDYIKTSDAGEGLVFYGKVIVPFVDHFPKKTKLYEMMNTKLNEEDI